MSDRNKILLAIAASLLLHLLVFVIMVILTLFHWINRKETPLPQRRQVEVTILHAPPKKPDQAKPLAVATPTPPLIKEHKSPPRPRTIDTEGLQASEKPPDKVDFESDKNSRAASELPPTGKDAVPSQAGRDDLKFMDFKTQKYSTGRNHGSANNNNQRLQPNSEPITKVRPQPTPAPTPKETPSPAEEMARLSDNLFALQKPTPSGKPLQTLQPTPPPPIKDFTPVKSPSGYQAQKQQTKLAGSISNRGRAGVNALGTPLGRYQKLVGDAVGSRWYYYIDQRMDLLTTGEARIRFFVNASGHVEDIQVMSNSSNPLFEEYCIQSITKAELPPIPADLATLLDDGKLEIEYSFTIYPN